MRTLRKLLVGATTAVSLGAGLGAPLSLARADEIDTFGQRIIDLEAQVRELDIQLKPQGPTAEGVARRLIDGQVLYELKNYEAAATILLDLTEKHPTAPEYPEALYYLADSLYLKRDFLSARRYYEKTVETGPRAKHYQEALQRLIELSLYTGDYAPVDTYLQKLGDLGASDPNSSVPYVKGKYFFFRQRYDDGVSVLSSIPKTSSYWFQAQYFIGACKVAQQKPGEAVQVFDALSKVEAKTDSQKRVQELTHMALGRIYYDQGQLGSATIEYSKISQKSDLFADSLYEGAWVAIKDKLYQKAYRSLDLLLTVVPEGALIPEVKLLMGNLDIRQNEWDEATKSFIKTRDDFELVKKDLDAALASQGDSQKYFKELITKNLGKFDMSTYLPKSALKWVSKDPEVEKLVTVLGDASDLARSITESEEIIARLEKALSGSGKVNIFPELAQARTRSLEAGNQLIDVENQLLQAETKLVEPVAGAERAQIEQATRERMRLQKELANLPRGKDSYQERMKKARAAYDELDKRAVEINVTISNYVAERVAIEKYFHDTAQDQKPDAKVVFDKQLAEAKAIEDELTHAQERIRQDIQDAVREVGVDDAQMQAEEGLKKQLQQVMAQEHDLFAATRGRLDGNARTKADQIETLLTRGRSAHQSIDGFNTRIDGLIESRLGDIKVAVAEEKAHVIEYRAALGGYQAEASDVGGGVTAQSFRGITDRFYQLVVRADVGIVDVSWALKQNKTDENSRLVREKKRELKLLDDEFKDVLKE